MCHTKCINANSSIYIINKPPVSISGYNNIFTILDENSIENKTKSIENDLYLDQYIYAHVMTREYNLYTSPNAICPAGSVILVG